MLPAATYEIRNSFNYFPGTDETERRSGFENFWATYIERPNYLTNLFRKNVLK